MKKYLNKIEETLKIKFNDKSLLLKTFIHKSFDKNKNNEKLEFLGDRVIGLIISKKLISMYPKESEGIIDKKFANLVKVDKADRQQLSFLDSHCQKSKSTGVDFHQNPSRYNMSMGKVCFELAELSR